MKPTPAMFNRLRAPSEPHADKAPDTKSPAQPAQATLPETRVLPGLQSSPERKRRRDLINALLLTDKEQERAALREELAKLEAEFPARPSGSAADIARVVEGLVLEARTPATPGVVSVRVTGAGANEEKVPLEGLRVKATLGDKTAEGISDETGQALVFLGGSGSFEVEVLSDSGETLQSAKGLLSPGKSVSLDVSLSERPQLADRLARGRAYLEAMRQRAARGASVPSSDTRALEQRIATLESTVARLEQALARLTQEDTKEEKPTQDTKKTTGGAP